MNIKLLAFDLDGTTLNSDKAISPANKAALTAAYRAGIKLVPCTGRSLFFLSDALISLLNELGFAAFDYIITDNGAQAYALPTKELIFTRYIDEQTAIEVLKKARRLRTLIYSSFGAQAATDNKGLIWENGEGQALIDSYTEKWYDPLADLEGLIRWNQGAVKFTIVFSPHEDFFAAKNDFEKLRLSLVSSDVKSFELMAAGIHKGETLRFVSEYSGVPMNQIMAIGDNYNDIEMISGAGWGVAMGNAVPELKEKACWVTETNDHDGLAVAIHKMLAEQDYSETI